MKWKTETVPLTGLEGAVAGVCPASREDRPRWFLATHDGRLRGIDLDDGVIFFEAQLPFVFAENTPATLVASNDGRYLAVVQRFGVQGALYEVPSGRLLNTLSREDYHANVSAWALAIVNQVLIISTAWNRLEALALPSLERLAPKADESSLDYFWGHVTASADGKRLASFGWFWHPVGAVRFVDVPTWLGSAVDPPSEAFSSQFADWWDDSVCWLDEGRVAMRGQPTAEDDMFDQSEGLVVVDLATKAVKQFFPGLQPAEIAFDGTHLLSLGAQTHCVSLETGEVKAVLERRTDAWHPGARVALTIPHGDETNFELHWLTGTLAANVELPRTPTTEALLVLADALEEQGLPAELISHCRERGGHGRRCWVLEGFRERAPLKN